MKLHLITIGQPKLAYAKLGWQEYWARLGRYHQLRATHIPDKHNDAAHVQAAIGNSYSVGLVIGAQQFSSPALATFLTQRELEAREVSFIIGGPDGLPQDIIKNLDYRWGFSELTFPHDLAMLILLESLYRASTIKAGQPYHH